MRLEHLSLLRSPDTGEPLELIDAEIIDGEVRSGALRENGSGQLWPIIEHIPRFVPIDNYCDNFSIQWEKYGHVLDPRQTGLTLYEDRWEKETRWPENMNGELIIEAGCGPGVFTHFALKTGATVMSFDYSRGVEINYRQNHHPNLIVVQADICSIPFVPADRVCCFGVLQHTPDPRKSFMELVGAIKPGGFIASDIYQKVPLNFGFHLNILKSKYFLRKWLPVMNSRKLERFVSRYVDAMWPISRFFVNLGRRGVLLSQLLLLDDWPKSLPSLRKEHQRDLAKIMIYDMLSPRFDTPVSLDEFLLWHREAGLENIDVHPGYNGLEGRGQKTGLGG
jgi:SAM-dependent methyltransferase